MGGMGEVFLALDPAGDGLDRFVALKCLHLHLEDDPRLIDMFYREARICSLFRHKNLIRVEDARRMGERHTMVMEFAPGVTLREILDRLEARSEVAPTPHIVEVLHQVSRGLHHAHSLRKADGHALGIVHRDLSPDNILVGFDGLVRVIDFGVAAAASRSAQDGLVGKIAYMSPEQCRGEALDARSDLYSLGTVYWELLEGRAPYPRTDRIASLRAITEDNLHAPASATRRQHADALDAIWLKLHAKHPSDRFPDARSVADAFEVVFQRVGDETGETLGGWVQRLFPHEAAELRTVCEKILRAPPPNAHTVDLDNVDLPERGASPAARRPRLELYDDETVITDVSDSPEDDRSIQLGPTEFTTLSEVQRWRKQRRGLLIAAGILAATVVGLLLWLPFLRAPAPVDVPVVSVVVTTEPATARIAINASLLSEESPTMLRATLGEVVRIDASAPGYLSEFRELQVDRDLVAHGLAIRLEPDRSSPIAPIGEVRVNYLPADAVLSMNGVQKAESSPATILRIPLNTAHALRLDRPGYETLFIDVRLQNDEPLEFDLEMNEGVPLARLSINSAPNGARVFVDGQPVGVTPLVNLELPAHTTYTVEMQMSGYRTWRRGVVLQNDDMELNAALDRDVATPPRASDDAPAVIPPTAGQRTPRPNVEGSPYRMID